MFNKKFFSFLYKKRKEEAWFSFIILRLAFIILFLFLLDMTLPSHVELAKGKHIITRSFRSGNSYSRFEETSMEMNGRSVYDKNAIELYLKGDSVFLHTSPVFGVIKFFHTETKYPKIWWNSFSPIMVFSFVPILMLGGFFFYFLANHHYDSDLVLKLSIFETILTITLFLFMINA